MKSIFRRSYFFLVVIILCCGWPSHGFADTGGGSGDPISPYIELDLPEDRITVNRLKSECASSRNINFTTSSEKHFYGLRIGIMYVKPGTTLSKIYYSFLGKVDGEYEPREIEFSNITTMTVLEKDSNTVTLELDLFPNITIDELLDEKPKYTDLKKEYAKTVTIVIFLNNYKTLAFVESNTEEETPPKIVGLFNEIPNGQRIEFMSNDSACLWWAIESVRGDYAYPRRKTYMDKAAPVSGGYNIFSR